MKECLSRNSTVRERLESSLESLEERSIIGKNEGGSRLTIEPSRGTRDTLEKRSSTRLRKVEFETRPERRYVTPEFLPTPRKTISNDKSSGLERDTLTTKLSAILDRVSTSREKGLTPFWNKGFEEISKRLWLPIETGCVDSVLSLPNDSLNGEVGRSWFSIKRKTPQNPSWSATSSQSSQYLLPEFTVCEPTASLRKSKKASKKTERRMKTLKMRIHPTPSEREKLGLLLRQFRWYYNAITTIFYLHFGCENVLKTRKYSYYTLRNLFRNYSFEQREGENNLVFEFFTHDQNRDEIPCPEWWRGNVHNRLPRGAVFKFTSSLNSAISNRLEGHTTHFTMKPMTRKNNQEYIFFEDRGYPSFIKEIQGGWWYTTRDRRRVKLSFFDLLKQSKERGLEIIHEKDTDKYFLHYPVESDWFPEDDRRSDNQAKLRSKGDRIISLDPGVRKFMVGYDPSGKVLFFGEGAHRKLVRLLLKIDSLSRRKQIRVWRRVKNLVSELHFKTASVLVKEYGTILLPEFRISEMVRGKKLSKQTKRLLYVFSYHKFKAILTWKCEEYNRKLVLVNESYTSCTCGVCGTINRTKDEIYKCGKCGLVIDRDISGSRNILLKHLHVR